jgi:hypothetical protein
MSFGIKGERHLHIFIPV